MNEQTPNIFETIENEKFFNPLTCRNRALYYASIQLLIERSREVPMLYETEARDALALFLANTRIRIETEDIGGEISASAAAPENAALILRYFRECGWILPRELGRNGSNLAGISSPCRKLMEALQRIFEEDGTGALTNHIFSVYEILESATQGESLRRERPYTNILLPLMEHVEELKNELFSLKDGVHDIVHAVLKLADVGSFGSFLLKDELLKRFFDDYFFIKNEGRLPEYISRINSMLSELRAGDLYERMIHEYGEIRHTDEVTAHETVNRQFTALEIFIGIEYQQEMTQIDHRINTWYNLYAARMLMVLADSTNLQSQLNHLLMELKDMEEPERGELLAALSSCFRLQSFGYVGRRSIARRQKRNANRTTRPLTANVLSGEELRKLTEDAIRASGDRYQPELVRAFFERQAFRGDTLRVEDLKLQTRDDAMILAAGMIYAGSRELPYEIHLEQGTVETEVATVSEMEIIRRHV